MGIEYPNREHRNADRAARRRALDALDGITGETRMLHRLLGADEAELDGDSTWHLAEYVREVTKNLSVLGALREVREWHAADMAQADAGEGGQ